MGKAPRDLALDLLLDVVHCANTGAGVGKGCLLRQEHVPLGPFPKAPKRGSPSAPGLKTVMASTSPGVVLCQRASREVFGN